MEKISKLTLVTLCLASLCRLTISSDPCPKRPLVPCDSDDDCPGLQSVCMGRPGEQHYCRHCQCADTTRCSFMGGTNRVYCPPCESVRDSCRDVESRINGEYLFSNGNNQTYTAYCEFHTDYVYMFIPSATLVPISIDLINPSKKQVMVRLIRSSGDQIQTSMEQLPSYSMYDLSIQYNQNVDYKTPQNVNTLRPYMYAGFIPANVADQHTVQGFRANTNDLDFENCDGNGNSYLTCYFNPNGGTPTRNPSSNWSLIRRWLDVVRPADNRLPECYFFPICEMHMGGCGAYALTGYRQMHNIKGAIIGLRLDF